MATHQMLLCIIEDVMYRSMYSMFNKNENIRCRKKKLNTK